MRYILKFNMFDGIYLAIASGLPYVRDIHVGCALARDSAIILRNRLRPAGFAASRADFLHALLIA